MDDVLSSSKSLGFGVIEGRCCGVALLCHILLVSLYKISLGLVSSCSFWIHNMQYLPATLLVGRVKYSIHFNVEYFARSYKCPSISSVDNVVKNIKLLSITPNPRTRQTEIPQRTLYQGNQLNSSDGRSL